MADLRWEVRVGDSRDLLRAMLEGARFLGLELEPKHAEIARARIAHWAAQVPKQGELWPAASVAS